MVLAVTVMLGDLVAEYSELATMTTLSAVVAPSGETDAFGVTEVFCAAQRSNCSEFRTRFVCTNELLFVHAALSNSCVNPSRLRGVVEL